MIRKSIALFLALCLTFAIGCVPVLAESTTQVIPSDQTVTTFGRTYYSNNSLHFNWTNSGFQFTFTGTSVSAVFNAANSVSAGTFLKVYVDDNDPVTLNLPNRNNNTVVLAENLENKTHRVRVVKRSENVWGGTVSVSKLLMDGTIGAPPANATRKIEVIGDSITCGFGNMVTPTTGAGGYQSKEEDGTATYATLAASYFGADCSVIARSGIGFSCDSAGNKNLLMGAVYGYTDHLSGGGTASPAWDFAANPSDVVILALGTNDTANSDSADYETKARQMLSIVRANNPDSHIIWAYGMMTDSRSNILKQIVADANASGDKKVYYHALTHMNSIENGPGGGGHPGAAAHVYNSKTLASLIAQVTGWKTITPVEYQNGDTTSLMIFDGESTTNTSAAFSTVLSLDSQHTQGNNSLKMNYTTAIDQQNKVGGMAFLQMPQSLDLSDYQTATFDLYVGQNMTGSNGLQVNFATTGEDGYNCLVGLDNLTQGWHTLSINLKAVSPAVSTADWSNINKIRITWMNYAQLGPTYFLLDNFQANKTGSNMVQIPCDTTPSADRQAAKAVADQITNLTADDAKAVADTRAAYEALTDTQKAMVPTIANLVACEAQVAQQEADKAAAKVVVDLIDALNVQSLEDKPAVAAARAAYDGLTDTQKDLVTNLAKLVDAEAKIAELEKPVDPPVTITYGDVDGNGKVEATDALEVLKSVVGKVTLTDDQKTAGDTDGNGQVDATDALNILKKVVGKIDKFPVEE